jgi:transposase
VIPAGVQVFVALEPVDLRFGFERLSGWVRERIGYDARSGALFVFVGRRRTTAKIAFADGSGVCLFWKKLDRGTFALPEAPPGGAAHVELDEATLEALLDGLPIGPAAETARPSRRRVH